MSRRHKHRGLDVSVRGWGAFCSRRLIDRNMEFDALVLCGECGQLRSQTLIRVFCADPAFQDSVCMLCMSGLSYCAGFFFRFCHALLLVAVFAVTFCIMAFQL